MTPEQEKFIRAANAEMLELGSEFRDMPQCILLREVDALRERIKKMLPVVRNNVLGNGPTGQECVLCGGKWKPFTEEKHIGDCVAAKPPWVTETTDLSGYKPFQCLCGREETCRYCVGMKHG